MRSLLLPAIALAFVLAVPAPAQTVLFSDGFENGLSNWSTTGLWHLVDDTDACGALVAPFPEGTHGVYYGIGGACNFDTGATNSGELTLLTPITLPAAGSVASLRCWTRHQTENCFNSDWDTFDIEISLNGGTSWTVLAHRCDLDIPTPEDWEPRNVDLTPYLGQSILVRFKFDTVDSFWNDFLGAWVDRVEIRLEAGHSFCANGCPCANQPSFYYDPVISYGGWTGCMNSQGQQAELVGSGTPSVSSDSLVLTASSMRTPTMVTFLQSTGFTYGNLNGDGRLCLAGTSRRLSTQPARTGTASIPGPGSSPISILGLIPVTGATRYYQAIYRDPAVWCTSVRLNFTDGYAITWTP